MSTSIANNDWIPIPDHEGYVCNPSGQIASKKSKGYKLLTIEARDKQTVRITYEGNTVRRDVHYLVALTFLPNPSNFPHVKHENGESWDNQPENLAWVAEEPSYSSLRYGEKKMRETVDNFSEWKTLEDYPFYYFHPNGMVMSVAQRITIMKHIMKPKPSLILINKEGEKGMVQIAFLMAAAFIPNPEGYTEVIEVDGKIENVAVSNLQWDVNSPTTLRDLKTELEDTEMWRPIEAYPGYVISRRGELVSVRAKHYVLMKPIEGQAQTTYRITDSSTGDQPTIPVQKLLGLAFLPNPLQHKYVAPINGDMTDYDLDNLYWHGNPNGCSEEGWIDVQGFPDYEVSGFGVRNKDTKIMLNPIHRKGGDYPAVTLRVFGETKTKTIYIHLVIARNLIPNPNNYPIVNHKDGNHGNYNVNNLEWCSHSQNLQHAYDTGLRDGSSSVTTTPTGNEIWKSVEIAPGYQVSNTGIVMNPKGRIMKLRCHAGYHSVTLRAQMVKAKYPYVHRLVAFAFLDTDHLGNPLDPEAVYEVNHKNRIRSDNRVENLEIISVKHHREKDQGKAVVAVEPKSCEIKEFETITQAAQAMKETPRIISKALRDGEDKNGWYYFLRDDPDLEDKVEFICEQ
jgi:hypothetical protein